MVREYGLRANVFERWMCHYNGGLNSRYPCGIKGCNNKLKNGRCGLTICRLESREDNSLTGKCLDYHKGNRSIK